MLKKMFRRIKSQKGMSGVLVSLLLVIVGVALVGGVQTFLESQRTVVQTQTAVAINKALSI